MDTLILLFIGFIVGVPFGMLLYAFFEKSLSMDEYDTLYRSLKQEMIVMEHRFMEERLRLLDRIHTLEEKQAN